MGLFKKIFSDVADELKKSLEETKKEMRNSLEEMKQNAMAGFTDSTSNSRDDDEEDDEEPKILLGDFSDGVLTIREGITELDGESLEHYKRIRKIVFPASLENLDSYVIDEQHQLEELDFSKVTKLKTIPDDFISGENKISKFVIPNGVTEVGSGFLGDAKSGAEIFVPASVSKLGFISENSNNDMIVYLFAADIDISDVESCAKTLYVLPNYYAQYAKKLKDCYSEASLREMPDDKMDIYGKVSESIPTKKPVESIQHKQNCAPSVDEGHLENNSKLEPVPEPEIVSEPKSEPETETKVEVEQKGEPIENGGLFSARLEAMIAAALQDGVLTDKERELLKRRVEKEGEDWDEVEMIIEARLAEIQPSATVTQISQAQVQSEVVTPVQESPYLVVNGKEYKDVSIDEIDEDILTNVTGLNASDIISVTIPSSVKGIKKNAFFSFYKLKELVIPSSVERIEDEAFGIILSDMSYEKLHINCPIIPSDLFNGAPLEEVILGDCVNKIEDRAFANCENLTSVTIPCKVIEIGDSAFCSCANLKKVDLGKCDKLESIGSYAFGDCKNLTEIDLSNCVSLKHCGGDAFQYCENIRTIDFSNCESLDLPWFSIKSNTKLVLPLGQQTFNKLFLLEQNGYNIDTSKCNNVKVVYDGAFKEMEIKEIVIPDTVETIGENAFDECENLKTIVMPAALKEIKAPLGSSLEQLKKVDFSKVTQLRTIPKKLFDYGCDKLKELMIPNGVTEIEDDALLELGSLKKLFLPPSLTTIGDLGQIRLSIYCFSPSLDELEPIVYGWDDDDDDEWDEEDLEELDEEELEELKEKSKKMKINLYVLPQYVEKYVSQRNAERIPEDVLMINEIPEEFRYYYDN